MSGCLGFRVPLKVSGRVGGLLECRGLGLVLGLRVWGIRFGV